MSLSKRLREIVWLPKAIEATANVQSRRVVTVNLMLRKRSDALHQLLAGTFGSV